MFSFVSQLSVKAPHYLFTVTLSNVFPTAIATVEVARRLVVVVVALAISLVFGSTASGRLGRCRRRRFVIRVQAFALPGLMRVRKRVDTKACVSSLSYTHSTQSQTQTPANLRAVELLFVFAAVATVVVARRLVVVVIAVAVTLVFRVAAGRFFRWLVVGIHTFALSEEN